MPCKDKTKAKACAKASWKKRFATPEGRRAILDANNRYRANVQKQKAPRERFTKSRKDYRIEQWEKNKKIPGFLEAHRAANRVYREELKKKRLARIENAKRLVAEAERRALQSRTQVQYGITRKEAA